MTRTIGWLFTGLLCLAVSGPAQTLIEHGLAASGGTVAGVAGKGISDGIDGIMRGLDAQAKKAAVKEPPKAPKETKPAPPSVKAQFAPSELPNPSSDGGGLARHTGALKAQRTGAEPAATVEAVAAPVNAIPAPKPVEMLPETSREALLQIAVGVSREDLIAKAGKPASQITMDEDGHLLEVYRYQARGESLATVRILDGAVSSVTVSQ